MRMDNQMQHQQEGAEAPFYLPQSDECDIFEAAFRNELPLLLFIAVVWLVLAKPF